MSKLKKELMISEYEYRLIAAFIVATRVSTVMNFIGQKLWVFRSIVFIESGEI